MYFNWRPITILYWFCHTSTWICHRCARVPHPEPRSHIPPHTIPLGHPSAPAPSILYPASTWTGNSFHIWYYTCFNAILPNHHTLSRHYSSNIIWASLGEGNGTPLQYSCLENPMDGGAWWAALHGVARSQTHWATSLSLFTFKHWRRKWQPTPVFLPGESQGRGSLLGCCLWGRTESDTTEAT